MSDVFTLETLERVTPGTIVIVDDGEKRYRYTVALWSGKDVDPVPGWGFSSWTELGKAEERLALIRSGAEPPMRPHPRAP